MIGWLFTGSEIYDRLLGLLIGIVLLGIIVSVVNWIRRKIGRLNEKKVVWALKAAWGTMDKAALVRETGLSRWKLDVVIHALQDKELLDEDIVHPFDTSRWLPPPAISARKPGTTPDEFMEQLRPTCLPPLVYLCTQRQTGEGNH